MLCFALAGGLIMSGRLSVKPQWLIWNTWGLSKVVLAWPVLFVILNCCVSPVFTWSFLVALPLYPAPPPSSPLLWWHCCSYGWFWLNSTYSFTYVETPLYGWTMLSHGVREDSNVLSFKNGLTVKDSVHCIQPFEGPFLPLWLPPLLYNMPFLPIPTALTSSVGLPYLSLACCSSLSLSWLSAAAVCTVYPSQLEGHSAPDSLLIA